MGALRVHKDLKNPLSDNSESFYMVLETSGSNERHDNEKLEAFLESAIESDLITNGAVAQDGSQFQAFWRIREGVPEALTTYKAMYKYDLSIPLEPMYDLVEEMRSRVEDKALV